MADEKFSVAGVAMRMQTIEDHFAAFADTLDKINGYVESNVNASLASSAYGDLGAKLLSIWNYNAATFNDFHENFDNWSQVVAIISAHNSKFAVDAQATYRDHAGTLDGVQEARDFVSKSNGLANVSTTDGFKSLSEDAREVLDSAFRAVTEQTQNNNTYGGKTITYTDAEGKKIELYYDSEGNYVGKKVTDENGHTDYYNKKGVKIDKLPTKDEYEAERAAKKEELENLFDTNYMKYIDDLKYGTFSERLVYHDEETGLDIPYYVYKPDYGREVTGTPTTLWMHGSSSSEKGWLTNGLTSIIYNQNATPEGTVIMPYIENHEAKGLTTALKNLTDKIVAETNGDKNKITVTGHSYGGIVTYRMVNDNPGYFAAAIPISGGSGPITDAFADTKTWIFNGTSETGTSYAAASTAQKRINSVGGEVRLTGLGAGHARTQTITWEKEYVSPDGDTVNPLFWLQRQEKGSDSSNA